MGVGGAKPALRRVWLASSTRGRQTSRVATHLSDTPTWVFVLFFGLLVLGARRLRDSRAHPLRLALMPLATSTLSLYGVISTFGLSLWSSCAWLIGAAAAVGLSLRGRPALGGYDADSGTVHVAGSIAPLAAMMGIFFTKYALTVALLFDPALRELTPLALGASALLGAFSGALAGRALRALAELPSLANRGSVVGNRRTAGLNPLSPKQLAGTAARRQ